MNKKRNSSLFTRPKLLMALVLLLLLAGTAVGSYFLLKRNQEGAEKAGKSPSAQIEKEQEQKTQEPRSAEEISRSQVPPEGKGLLFEGKTPFFLYVYNPEDGLQLTTSQVIVRGQTVPGAEVFVNEMETKADAKGNFSLRVTLEEGENPLVISAGNESGEAEIERTVYYEK